MKKKWVKRTCELYFQDKLSLPRKFFQNTARLLIPEPMARRGKPVANFTNAIQR